MKKLSNLVLEFLKFQQFLFVGTADLRCKPHTSAKPILKIEDDSIYLVDYIIGKTNDNIGVNPYVSLSAIDLEKIVGYQLFGKARILNSGHEFQRLLNELHDKQVNDATDKLISGVREGKKSKGFEIASLKGSSIIKVRIKEVTKLDPDGYVQRESLESPGSIRT